MALSGFKIIDADGHVTEPASLYSTHIDLKIPHSRRCSAVAGRRWQSGNRAGAVSEVEDGGASSSGEANEVPGLGKLPSGRNHPLASPSGGYDPAERIRDMDKEEIDVAVCFATVATCGYAPRAIPR